jgi:hypothetical protein
VEASILTVEPSAVVAESSFTTSAAITLPETTLLLYTFVFHVPWPALNRAMQDLGTFGLEDSWV